MSEYQYYEFQAIDRPLTPKEQAEIKELSSRVKLTPTQAIFLYNYGDFRNKPEDVVAKYFDMMFYIANWGSWRLIFRFPKAIVDPNLFQAYALPNGITITQTPKYIVLDIEINQEEGVSGWVEGEGWLSQLLPLREDLLGGDLRLLYLVWLKVAPELAGYVLDEDPVEPSIPANLSELSPSLKAFIELVELDPELMAAGAQASPKRQVASEVSLEDSLSMLSTGERQEYLLKLVRREPHVDVQLINRLKELAGMGKSTPEFTAGYRRFSELQSIANNVKSEWEERERERARKQRVKELEILASKEAQTWKKVVDLIELKQAKPYDEATALLKDLRDLAVDRGRLPEFNERFAKIKSDYSNRFSRGEATPTALMTRLRSIK
jgi:hypothetical protein